MKKMDMILIAVVLLAAAGIYFFYSAGAEEGKAAIVTVDGEWKATLPLESSTEESIQSSSTIQTDWGYNIITVQNGQVFVKEADCRDHICVEHKKISRVGETIVCLPHKLVVEIKGEAPADFDAVVI